MWIYLAHRREHASPVRRRRSPLASSFRRAPANAARPRIPASVSRDVPVYFPSFRWVLILPTHGRMA